jgi:hypothetical protein
MKTLIAVFAAASLSACAAAGPTAFGPADSKGFGFEDTRIESDRYRVTYRGSGGMGPEQVEDYALLRAGQLALANDYDWFRVISCDMSGEQRGGVGIGAGVGGGSYGRRSGVGVGVSGDLGTIGGRDYFTARLEVLMGKGEPPESGDYYDAADIVERIGGQPVE